MKFIGFELLEGGMVFINVPAIAFIRQFDDGMLIGTIGGAEHGVKGTVQELMARFKLGI